MGLTKSFVKTKQRKLFEEQQAEKNHDNRTPEDDPHIFAVDRRSLAINKLVHTLPNNLSLVGFVFDTQFAVKDSVNALGLVFSAGGEGKVGR